MERVTCMKTLALTTTLALCLAPLAASAQSAHDPIPLSEIVGPRGQRPGASDKKRPPSGRKEVTPRLVVVLVADQFRAEFLTRYGRDFGPKGFRRLMSEGAVFTGRYEQQNTYTGPGHALLASGSFAYVNGIMQNKFYNFATKRSESMLFDASAKLLHGETTPDDETSPRNFEGSTIGDELRLASPDSKVIGLALKDRGAIMLAGRTGTAYFQSEATGDVTTSTYYRSDLPEWLVKFNAARPADAAFGKSWERVLPKDRYVGADDSKWEAEGKGMGRTFPHPVTGKLSKPGPDFYTMFQHSPFGIDLTFALAKAAIEGEALGGRGVTDMLGISVTPTDLAGHAYGPYSHEMQDMIFRLDGALADFLGYLDRRYKPGEVVLAFTADHGAVPIPEEMKERGLSAARLKKAQIKEAVTKALNERFGAADWVLALEDPSVYLNRPVIAEKKVDPALVERAAAEAVLGLPGVAGAFTRTQLLNGWLPPTRIAELVARSFYPARSGDVVIVQSPFSFWGKYGEKDQGSTHGSAYRYDTDVPLVFVGAAFVPGNYGVASQNDLAPTLARVLGIGEPAGCEGDVLDRALR
ncbi:alkaline phosphatase family protein [Myxococcota bacterium]|nr:alkaline phosphatase family protein [Myxococcota bacterium]